MEFVNIVTQPHNGRPESIYKPHQDMFRLSLAKVIKVCYETGTANVQMIKSNNTLGSSNADDEGTYSVRIMCASAHYNNEHRSVSGTIEPVLEGQLVLVGFIDGLKSQPIILGSIHNTWSYQNNILSPRYLRIDQGDKGKYLKVFPSQNYTKVDGFGGVEISHPSKTFLKMSHEDMSDEHLGFDHDDLSEKDPITGETFYGKTESSRLPINVLLVHRSCAVDDNTTWTKFFISKEGTFRISRIPNDGTTSIIECHEQGGISLQRNTLNGQSSSIQLLETGEISITRAVSEQKVTRMTISESGEVTLNHHSGSYISFTENGDIHIHSVNRIYMTQRGE